MVNYFLSHFVLVETNHNVSHQSKYLVQEPIIRLDPLKFIKLWFALYIRDSLISRNNAYDWFLSSSLTKATKTSDSSYDDDLVTEESDRHINSKISTESQQSHRA